MRHWDFAFRFLSPMRLNPTSLIDPSTVNGLLRFCDVALHAWEATPPPNLVVCAAFSVPRVHSFGSHPRLSPDEMNSLLQSPSMATLQSLSVLTLTEPMMALVTTRLRNLRSLRVSESITAQCYAHLPAFPHLTHLSLDAGHEDGISGVLHHIIACLQLRSLALTRFTASQLASLLSPSEFAGRLKILNLTSSDFESVGGGSALFASCALLADLFLTDCEHITSVLLAAVHSCPRLESLSVFQAELRWYALWDHGVHAGTQGAIPTPAEIQQMLEARRVAIKAGPEVAPLTVTLSPLSDAQVGEDYAQNASCRYHDWQPVRDAFKTLVTADEDAAELRFELMEI